MFWWWELNFKHSIPQDKKQQISFIHTINTVLMLKTKVLSCNGTINIFKPFHYENSINKNEFILAIIKTTS